MSGQRLKDILFRPTTVEKVLRLPDYEYKGRTSGRTVPGVARVLQSHMHHPQKLIVRFPVIPSILPGNTDVRYGRYLELREQGPDEEPKTPFRLLLEHFPLSLNEEPPVGTKVRVPGTGNSFFYIPFLEQLERALITWYDRHKYTGETPELLIARIDDEVRMIPEEEHEGLEERIAMNGANFFSQVPSRSTKRPHAGAVYHVPYMEDKEHIGAVWRKLQWSSGSRYNEILAAGQPSAEQLAKFGERTPVTADQLAQLDKIARYCENHGNIVPRKWSPIIRFPKSIFTMYANMRRVVLWLPGEEPRLLRDPEMSALFGYALRNNNCTPFAIVQPYTREERFELGRFGYVK